MVNNIGLKLRMVFVSSVLFGIYAIAALSLMTIYNIDLVVISALTLGFIIFQYFISQKLILKSVRAQSLPNNYKWIETFAEGYCRDKNMKNPDIYLAEMNMPNAFAFGRRNNGTVVVSKELLKRLEKEEIKGVVAHELAHIENRDSIIMLLGQSVSTIVGIAVIVLSRRRGGGFFVSLILAQVAQFMVSIILMALSRYREYIADETAADYMGTGNPLASALSKISSSELDKERNELDTEVGALCIIGPKNLLSSHPPVEKRIEKLRKL